MSSPFQKAFMGKDPIKTIKLSDKDLKGKKSASSRPAKEISYEGQGGIDYENDARLAINPEGQGGIDYEAKDYKKKTSPLDSYSNPGQVKYFSNKQDFKALQDKIVQSTDAETKAENQEARVNRRDERKIKKGITDPDFQTKTNTITGRAEDNRDIAAKKRKCAPGQTYDPVLGYCTP
jgi:hypothetical protein